jgi:hypothetical protein
LILQFGSTIREITKPFDQDHLENLSVKNLVIVRQSLLHKKYQHVVYFKYDHKRELAPWLRDYAATESGIKVESDGPWNRVYMVDSSHFTLFQLTWPDRINYTKTIRLISKP